MKTAALLGAFFLTLFIAPSPSHAADDNSVQSLLEICERENETAQFACLAYIQGVATVLNANCGFSAQGYSLPEFMKIDAGEVRPAALVQAFKNWARDNPQSWSADKMNGVIFAMSSTFPCNY